MAGIQDQGGRSPRGIPTENSLSRIHNMPESSNDEGDDISVKKMYDDTRGKIITSSTLDSMGESKNHDSTGGIEKPTGGLTSTAHNNNKTPYKPRMVNQEQQKKLDENRRGQRKTGGKPPYFDDKLHCEKKSLKIMDIDANVFIRVCNLLNINRIQGNDWRGLAGRLGYNVTDVKIFEDSKNKTDSMLCDWNAKPHHYIEDVVKNLEEMERADVVELLQQEIEKKGDGCNCVDCGHIV